MVAHRAELAEQVTADAVQAARRMTAEDVTTVLAHDLGNHLTPLQGHIDILRRTAQREGQSSYLATANQALAALGRIGQLIGDLLDAARLEHGLFALSVADIDLVLLIKDVAQRHDGTENSLRLQLPNELVVQADASRLSQALENLVSNAIRHSPESGTVSISLSAQTREHRDWGVVEVRDEGPGIPTDIAHTLFSRFSKGSGSQGLGLGLYLARGIAEAHGGTLTVESLVGEGSTFRLAVPTRAQRGRTTDGASLTPAP